MTAPLDGVFWVVAGALLVVLPTWADRSDEPAEEERRQQDRIAASEDTIRDHVLALEHEALELELERLDDKATELEHHLQELQTILEDLERDGTY